MGRIVIAAMVGFVTAALLFAGGSCTCETARRSQGWCDIHQVGYLAGVEIRSQLLFDALDSHGHEIEVDRLSCVDCKAAADSDGFCEEHRMGFVEGKAYLSRLAYQVARGRPIERSSIACPICKRNSDSHGWCDSCKRAMIGNIVLTEEQDYRRAARAYQTLLDANRTVARCELCAAAMVVDGRCPTCKISYDGGHPVVAEDP